jgi:hypothetical protein
MEHILLECKHNTRKIVWEEAKNLWPHSQHEWPRISFGTLLGVGCIKVPTNENNNENNERATPPGKQRKNKTTENNTSRSKPPDLGPKIRKNDTEEETFQPRDISEMGKSNK